MTAEEKLRALEIGAEYENMSVGQYGEFAALACQAIEMLREAKRFTQHDEDECDYHEDGICDCGFSEFLAKAGKFLDGV